MATGAIKRNADTSAIKLISGYQDKGFKIEFVDGHSFMAMVGKLDASNNYVQFWVDGTDKGYIKFTVSRNV